MLGEVHSLVHEFPDMEGTIEKLKSSDDSFAADNKRYDELDKEIRTLELNGAPIDDQAMHQLKHDRSELKDSLYQRLLAAS